MLDLLGIVTVYEWANLDCFTFIVTYFFAAIENFRNE